MIPMTQRAIRTLTLSLGLVISAGLAQAQDDEVSTNIVDAMQDWGVHESTDPRQCWAVSTFTESVNTFEDGRLRAVSRGNILLMVFYRPAENIAGQVAFTGGYPFAPGSFVDVEIGGNTYQMFTEGEWAWPTSEAEDAKIIAAMKRGADAVLTARSSRDTITKDTFSLLGFTAAVEEAETRCAEDG